MTYFLPCHLITYLDPCAFICIVFLQKTAIRTLYYLKNTIRNISFAKFSLGLLINFSMLVDYLGKPDVSCKLLEGTASPQKYICGQRILN